MADTKNGHGPRSKSLRVSRRKADAGQGTGSRSTQEAGEEVGWVTMSQLEADMLKNARGQLVTGEARLFDHAATTFRWFMATLFAANGGAIIGIFGLGGAQINTQIWLRSAGSQASPSVS